DAPRHRPAARVLCQDRRGRILLIKWRDPVDQTVFWEPPGGGIEPGESPIEAARRELHEETGLPAGAVLERSVVVQRDFRWNGQRFGGPETFFLGRVLQPEVPGAQDLTGDEDGALLSYRWFTRADLAAWPEPLQPPELGAILDQLAAEHTFLALADPAFSVTSDLVHEAREASWYARSSYGIAVLRHEQASALISHPNLKQGSSAWPAHHGITAGPFADWWANWVLNKEGADHRRLRKLLNPAFSRRVIEAAPPPVRAGAAERGGAVAPRGQCGLMAH